jgi:GNAT superfamily N-acetyltransferase
MTASVRRANTSDVHGVVTLIRAYSREVFQAEAAVTTEALLDDGFGSVLEFFVAETGSGDLVGFAAWEKTYDVVAGRRGGALLGLFVQHSARGRGTGDALLNAVANEVRAMGGVFLVGLGSSRSELGSEPPPSGRVREGGEAPRFHTAADISTAELLSLGHSLLPRAQRLR